MLVSNYLCNVNVSLALIGCCSEEGAVCERHS